MHQGALAAARRAGQAAALTMLGGVHLSADYNPAVAELRQALKLFRGLGHRRGQGDALSNLGELHRYTGDYPAAAASFRQALALCRDWGDRLTQAQVLTELAAAQRLAGDYRAAAASSQQALSLCREVGNRLGEAETLNCLGELASRTAEGRQDRDYHA